MRRSLLSCVPLLCLLFLPALAARADPAAIVTDVHGSVVLRQAERSSVPLKLFDTVQEGQRFVVARDARLVLFVPRAAAEFIMQSPGAYRIRAGELQAIDAASVPVRRAVAPVLAHLKLREGRMAQAAVVMRGPQSGDLALLEPAGETAADDARRFHWRDDRAQPGRATSYRFILADREGEPVVDLRLQGTALTLPENVVLRPLERYTWGVVRADEADRPVTVGQSFVVLPEDAQAASTRRLYGLLMAQQEQDGGRAVQRGSAAR